MNTTHQTGLINVFWPHYGVRAVCLECGWWGNPTHVRAAQQDAMTHALHPAEAA